MSLWVIMYGARKQTAGLLAKACSDPPIYTYKERERVCVCVCVCWGERERESLLSDDFELKIFQCLFSPHIKEVCFYIYALDIIPKRGEREK